MICKDWVAWLNTGRRGKEPNTQTQSDPQDSSNIGRQWTVAPLYHHRANLRIPARTVPDKEKQGSGNSRWHYQTLWKDPSDSKFNSETEKQELQGFVYWDMITCPLSLSSPKKQLELPRNWQSWYGCAQLSSSTPKPSLSTNWRGQGALSCRLSGGFFLVTTCTRCKRQDAICKVAFPGSPLSGWSHTKPADLHNALWFCFFTLEKRSSFENGTWGLKALLWQTVI